MTSLQSDQYAREEALDPATSFIVEAPAGSGKTELLTQRFLKLLSLAEKNPEEILAFTFTRKAASEMRQRIYQALLEAKASEIAPDAKKTSLFAKDVLKRDQALEWNLLDSPHRLRIQTIDSFCMHLLQESPVESKTGGAIEIAQYPEKIYEKAARTLLSTVLERKQTTAIDTILLHLDNQCEKFIQLLVDLLRQRDQWLPYLVDIHSLQEFRSYLEEQLVLTRKNYLQTLSKHIPSHLFIEFSHLWNMLQTTEPHTTDSLNYETTAWNAWEKIATILLTKEGKWRSRLTKSSQMESLPEKTYQNFKTKTLDLIAACSEIPGLDETLFQVFQQPPESYTESQWVLISSIYEILPHVLAELSLQFKGAQEIDYIEMNTRAFLSLGEDSVPSDRLLTFDRQIRHLLVDEFQDTSFFQFRLIEKIISGFTEGDGRTLFIVGDPMQSIYRFRKAEVGLFLKAQQQGIGSLVLKPLQLSRNFRTQPLLIDWFNPLFHQIFPKESNFQKGSIPYRASLATKTIPTDPPVIFHVVRHETEQAEKIIQTIHSIQQQNKDARIGVLVRARNHLPEILLALSRAHIPYRASEIQNLYTSPCIQDLLALTRALIHPSDTTAWLSVLRAPWCGATLETLHTHMAQNTHFLSFTEQFELFDSVTEESSRIHTCLNILKISLQHRHRKNFRDWLEGTWLTLGGPGYYDDASREMARIFFDKVETLQKNTPFIDEDHLNELLKTSLFTPPETHDTQVDIMTIHKSKGLEFEHVILPSLEKSARVSGHPLMLWSERQQASGEALWMAPIHGTHETSDPIFNFLMREEKEKDQQEDRRLLYVAMTRTIHQLHLFSVIDSEPSFKPNPRSFLHFLWPETEKNWTTDLPNTTKQVTLTPSLQNITRRTLHWNTPFNIQTETPLTSLSKPFLVPPSHSSEQIMGTLVHRLLAQIGKNGAAFSFDLDPIYIESSLLELGLRKNEVEEAYQKIKHVLQNVIHDPAGQFILAKHTHDAYEFAITWVEAGEIIHSQVDRTFVDEKGIRHLIDYKMTQNTQLSSQFISEEKQKYQSQLSQYAKVLRQFDPVHPIQLGLYFVTLPHFETWMDWM